MLISFMPLEMADNRKLLAVCLAGVLVSHLLVGLVSSTFLRHVVQVVPTVLCARRTVATPAPQPIFRAPNLYYLGITDGAHLDVPAWHRDILQRLVLADHLFANAG